jgi:hypothetical protein
MVGSFQKNEFKIILTSKKIIFKSKKFSIFKKFTHWSNFSWK